MIILDTCTLLWLAQAPPRLPEPVMRSIRRTAPGQRYVSAISAFEIGIKHIKGKLTLPKKPRAWFDESCAERGLLVLPITREIVHKTVELPRHHQDPADRIIIATAMEHGLTVLTPDPVFPAYGVRLVWG